MMTTKKEFAQASHALIQWFMSQEIPPLECLGVMAVTTGAILGQYVERAELKAHFDKIVQATIEYEYKAQG